MLNRLVYRKGIDLQALVIPALCHEYSNVRFIIGGDGPKRQALVAMQQRHGLSDRVELVGQVQHEAARDLLVQGALCRACTQKALQHGIHSTLIAWQLTCASFCTRAPSHEGHDRMHGSLIQPVVALSSLRIACADEMACAGDIFLNTSLTEAFCMAIVEAASCGLLVVSTNVGGVPEVLPAHMRQLADPTPDSLLTALRAAVQAAQQRPIDRQKQHDEVRSQRTAAVHSRMQSGVCFTSKHPGKYLVCNIATTTCSCSRCCKASSWRLFLFLWIAQCDLPVLKKGAQKARLCA